MLRHYLKVNVFVFFGSFFLVSIFVYVKAPNHPGNDAFYRAVLLSTVYLGMTQLIFSILTSSYFLISSIKLSINIKVAVLVLSHLAYFLFLAVRFNELLLIQSLINLLAFLYTYTQLKKEKI